MKTLLATLAACCLAACAPESKTTTVHEVEYIYVPVSAITTGEPDTVVVYVTEEVAAQCEEVVKGNKGKNK